MEGGNKFTITFNGKSKSKSTVIRTAIKIAKGYQYKITEDGYYHVSFDIWNPDMEKMLKIVGGLKGTFLIDQYGKQYKSKSDYESKMRALIKAKEKERQRLISQARKQLQKDVDDRDKDIQRTKKDLEKATNGHIAACRSRTINRVAMIIGGYFHLLISFSPFLVMYLLGELNESRASIATTVGLSVFLFLFLGIFFGLLFIDQYTKWKGNDARAGIFKGEEDAAILRLKKLLEPTGMCIPPEILDPDSISTVLQKTCSIRMEDVRAILGMDNDMFDTAIIDMAIELGFWIDGDDLVFDDGNQTTFMDWVKQIHAKNALLGQLADSMAGTGRIPMKDIKELTHLEDAQLDDRIIDWAIQFGFKIDGDEIVLDPHKLAGFINVLQTFSP